MEWAQLGTDIDGEAAGDNAGWSVSISADGSRVVVGSPENNGNGNDAGNIRVYEFNGADWVQLGPDIDGEAVDDNYGSTVSISSNSNIVAVGAPYNNGNGIDSGHIRVLNLQYTAIPDPNFEQALIDQGIDSEALLNGRVLTTDIYQVTSLDVSGLAIASLSGIEDFLAIEILHCNNNNLNSLDVSNNLNLQELWCGFNRLVDLDLSNNADLSVLSCSRNRITGLNLSANVNLSLLAL